MNNLGGFLKKKKRKELLFPGSKTGILMGENGRLNVLRVFERFLYRNTERIKYEFVLPNETIVTFSVI